jgi:amino acid permease
MPLSSRTSLEAAVAARTPPWSVALLAPGTGSPQEAAGGPACPLLIFYQPCLLLSMAVLEHYDLSNFLLEHFVSEYNLLCIFYTYTF